MGDHVYTVLCVGWVYGSCGSRETTPPGRLEGITCGGDRDMGHRPGGGERSKIIIQARGLLTPA